MDDARRREIEDEERARAETRQQIERENRPLGSWLLWVALVAAPAVNLLMGNRSWGYWTWAAVSWAIAIVVLYREGARITREEAGRAV